MRSIRSYTQNSEWSEHLIEICVPFVDLCNWFKSVSQQQSRGVKAKGCSHKDIWNACPQKPVVMPKQCYRKDLPVPQSLGIQQRHEVWTECPANVMKNWELFVCLLAMPQCRNLRNSQQLPATPSTSERSGSFPHLPWRERLVLNASRHGKPWQNVKVVQWTWAADL